MTIELLVWIYKYLSTAYSEVNKQSLHPGSPCISNGSGTSVVWNSSPHPCLNISTTLTNHPRRTTMARKSQRLSAGAATTLPSHKRAASNTSLPAGEVKRSKTQKATPTKSQYFSKPTGGSTRSKKKADDSGDELAPDDDDDEDELVSAPEDDLSEFGSAHDSDDAEDEDDDDNDDEYESEVEESKSRRKSSSKKAAVGKSKTVSGGELWREGVKTGLGPGQQVVIKKPKARPAGKVPYSDGSIHPNTLIFLKDLKGNNNREWLKSEFDYYCLPLASLHASIVSCYTMPYRRLPALCCHSSHLGACGLVDLAVYLIP
jgi:hypothetical protein